MEKNERGEAKSIESTKQNKETLKAKKNSKEAREILLNLNRRFDDNGWKTSETRIKNNLIN